MKFFKDIDKIIFEMESVVERGLHNSGVLPGKLKLNRKAKYLFTKTSELRDNSFESHLMYINAFALAASEENAAGNRIVTAPTSGASGVLPAIIYYAKLKLSKTQITKGILAAFTIGAIIKNNASISGAEVGCQGEIGSASAMGAAFLASANHQSIDVISSAARNSP